MPTTEIILASSSPRRIELLRQVGFRPKVRKPNVDEKLIRGEAPKKMVARLAREKAWAVSNTLRAPRQGLKIVIAADTTVVAPNGRTILGKPTSTNDAAKMLKALAGKAHVVHTGYCVVGIDSNGTRRTRVRVVTSKVHMRALTPAMIRGYVATKEPMDKAGSYAAQGIGMGLIEKLNGSYSNVVGLPMSQLLLDLEQDFGISTLGGQG